MKKNFDSEGWWVEGGGVEGEKGERRDGGVQEHERLK